MGNFFFEDKYFGDIDDLIYDLFEDDKDQINALPDDWTIKVELTELEPMFTLTAENIEDMLHSSDEERYSEDGDESEKIIKALKKCVDFEKLNSMMPKLLYTTNKFETITKKDLLNSM